MSSSITLTRVHIVMAQCNSMTDALRIEALRRPPSMDSATVVGHTSGIP
jgi:hypothetical protein